MFFVAVLLLGTIVTTVGYLGYKDVQTAGEGAAITQAIRAGKVVVLAAVVGGGVYVMPASTDLSGPDHEARLEAIASDLEQLGVTPQQNLTPAEVLAEGAVEAPTLQVQELKAALEARGYAVSVIDEASSAEEIRMAWAAPGAVPQVDMPLMSDEYGARKVDRGAESSVEQSRPSRGLVGVFGKY